MELFYSTHFINPPILFPFEKSKSTPKMSDDDSGIHVHMYENIAGTCSANVKMHDLQALARGST